MALQAVQCGRQGGVEHTMEKRVLVYNNNTGIVEKMEALLAG